MMLLDEKGDRNRQTRFKIEILSNPEDVTDFIFMDIGLPGMNGLELTQKIRQSNWKAKDVPIVAITGNDASFKDQCLAAGMDDFITKPFTFEQLKVALETYLK